jgi:hypothetical protein
MRTNLAIHLTPYALMKLFGSSNQIISVYISHVNIPSVIFRLNNFLVTYTLLFIEDFLYMLAAAISSAAVFF